MLVGGREMTVVMWEIEESDDVIAGKYFKYLKRVRFPSHTFIGRKNN